MEIVKKRSFSKTKKVSRFVTIINDKPSLTIVHEEKRRGDANQKDIGLPTKKF